LRKQARQRLWISALPTLELVWLLFTGLRLVEAICSGHLEGGAIRSTAINFTPGPTAAGSYTADTKTAGSCTLMVQQALPCLLFAKQPAER
jgi:RNA 3'-terminal phosphate cyclase (ATP)